LVPPAEVSDLRYQFFEQTAEQLPPFALFRYDMPALFGGALAGCGGRVEEEVRRLMLGNVTSEFRWVSPTWGDWRNKFERKDGGRNEGWMADEGVWLTFAGEFAAFELMLMRSRCNKCRGDRRRMRESEAQSTGGLHSEVLVEMLEEKWMNISTRVGVSTSHSNVNGERNAWTRRALSIAQTCEGGLTLLTHSKGIRFTKLISHAHE
ncbi:MAG: hypothetical protein ACTS44_01720, partial [Candidatus Hodgkinia cicadicola]